MVYIWYNLYRFFCLFVVVAVWFFLLFFVFVVVACFVFTLQIVTRPCLLLSNIRYYR